MISNKKSKSKNNKITKKHKKRNIRKKVPFIIQNEMEMDPFDYDNNTYKPRFQKPKKPDDSLQKQNFLQSELLISKFGQKNLVCWGSLQSPNSQILDLKKKKRKKRRLLTFFRYKQENPSQKEPKWYCIIHALCTNRNTLITATSSQGNAFATSSAAKPNDTYKNTRRNLRFSSQLAIQEVARKAFKRGYRYVELKLKGIGYGKRSLVKGITRTKLRIFKINDITSAPHNGCRPPKPKR